MLIKMVYIVWDERRTYSAPFPMRVIQTLVVFQKRFQGCITIKKKPLHSIGILWRNNRKSTQVNRCLSKSNFLKILDTVF